MKKERMAAMVTPVINGERDIVDIIIKTTFLRKNTKRLAKTTQDKQEKGKK